MPLYQTRITVLLLLASGASCGPEPVPLPGPTPAETLDLIDASPCDILPEDNGLGTRAHSAGYPYWSGTDIQFDSAAPRRIPDERVVYALTEGYTFENEVHDCQRLIVRVPGGLKFGPLVGLLPLDGAMNLPDVAFATPIPVATVYNWGDFDDETLPYTEMNIAPRWNCLWLRTTPSGWVGALTPHENRPCFERSVPEPAAFTLAVVRAHENQDNPPTARWGFDAVDSVNIFGVKCGSAWCWVGNPGFRAPGSPTGVTSIDLPGYYDQQHLAVPDGNGGIRPGPLARVTTSQGFFDASMQQTTVPDDVLGPLFAAGLIVATIEFPGLTAPPAPYDKWGTALPLAVRLRTAIENGSDGLPLMSVSFMSADGSETPIRNIEPIRNAAHSAMGAVRFRWHDTDNTETTWSACGPRGKDCCDSA